MTLTGDDAAERQPEQGPADRGEADAGERDAGEAGAGGEGGAGEGGAGAARCEVYAGLDPHGQLARWRREGGLRRVRVGRGRPVWVATRYEDVRRVLAEPRLGKEDLLGAVLRTRLAPGLGDAFSRNLLAADPPDHTRLRRLVSAAFTGRRIERLRPRIEGIAGELLGGMRGRPVVDLVEAFAAPLPMLAICELLGIADADRGAFAGWSAAMVAGQQPGVDLPSVVAEFVGYIRGLLAERRRRPGDDLISGLVQVRDRGDVLSEDELTSMVYLLLVAGVETTTNLIGTGIRSLLAERSRWERLCADPSLVPAAVEELLRHEAPVAMSTYRVAREGFELGGRRIEAGEGVLASLLSANRDERRFAQPGEVRLDRGAQPHLGFGHGIHYCLGAPLARVEAVVALCGVLTAYPGMELVAGGPDWRPGFLMRGLRTLPVRIG